MTGFGKFLGLVIVVFLLVGGYMAYSATRDAGSDDGHDMMVHDEDTAMEHDHSALEPVVSAEPMSVSVSITKDAKEGWNVHITPEGFTFAPEHASEDHVAGEGHAHIYVDDVKYARVYGEWYHVSGLTEGEHEITVALNTNDHHEYSFDSELVRASQVIVE